MSFFKKNYKKSKEHFTNTKQICFTYKMIVIKSINIQNVMLVTQNDLPIFINKLKI